MVRRFTGPIATLNDAWKAQREVWVVCLDCGHTAKLDPRSLIVKLGQELSDLPFDQLERRSKFACRRCRRRRVGFLPHYIPWGALR
jgi:hypothetical protein